MTQIIRGTVKQNVLLRSGPGTEFANVSWNGRNYLAIGTEIEALVPAVGGKWLQMSKIQGAEVTITAWSNAGAEQQYIGWQEVTVPDEPPPDPEPDPEPPPDFIEAHWVAPAKVVRYLPE